MKRVFEAPDAIFEVDDEKSVFFFTWNGTVSEESVIKIMTIATKASVVMEKVNWFIDRRNLEGYSAEARVWLKNDFIEDIGKELISKTHKIAALNSESTLSQISSNVLIDAFISQNEYIEYKAFPMSTPAINWLHGIREKEDKPKKKKGFFRR